MNWFSRERHTRLSKAENWKIVMVTDGLGSSTHYVYYKNLIGLWACVTYAYGYDGGTARKTFNSYSDAVNYIEREINFNTKELVRKNKTVKEIRFDKKV